MSHACQSGGVHKHTKCHIIKIIKTTNLHTIKSYIYTRRDFTYNKCAIISVPLIPNYFSLVLAFNLMK